MILKVLEKRLETNLVLSLILEKPANFAYYPGQYLDVELPVSDKYGNTRAFTVSSSPTEDFLMITTKKGDSKFKETMEQLKIGDFINTSHPAGTFTLDESQSAVFIAGGIGITPFRSIIKYAADQKLTTPISLIYLNSTADFLFKKELDEWQNTLPNLTIHYLSSPKQISNFQFPISNYIYYLAGPPKMVDDFEKMLLDLRVDQTNIRYDRFDGY